MKACCERPGSPRCPVVAFHHETRQANVFGACRPSAIPVAIRQEVRQPRLSRSERCYDRRAVAARGAHHRRHEIVHHFGFGQQVVVESDAESVFQAEQKLGPGQTVEPEVTV